MISSEIIKKIEEFVHKKPRSIQELAVYINKNWRTADRYVEKIKLEYGTIDTNVFRGGNRGALKIVYWKSIDQISHSFFQEDLEKEIMNGKTKYDLSPFDIFQHVPENKKYAWVKKGDDEVKLGKLSEFKDLLLKTEKQILFFSGNLSFINFKDKSTNIFEVLEKLVKTGISIKVVCRVDISGVDNINKLLSLNYKCGKELIQIRHREQPLRATIIDNKVVNIKEIKEPTGREKELNKKTFIFYTIYDREWVEWISKIFLKMFNTSIDSNKRISEMEKIPYYR